MRVGSVVFNASMRGWISTAVAGRQLEKAQAASRLHRHLEELAGVASWKGIGGALDKR